MEKVHFWIFSMSVVRQLGRLAGADLGGGCRGCAPPPPPGGVVGGGGGGGPPPPPRDDLRFSYTTGILQKKKLCGLLVLN